MRQNSHSVEPRSVWVGWEGFLLYWVGRTGQGCLGGMRALVEPDDGDSDEWMGEM